VCGVQWCRARHSGEKAATGLGGGLRALGELLRYPRDRARAVPSTSGTHGASGSSGWAGAVPAREAPQRWRRPR